MVDRAAALKASGRTPFFGWAPKSEFADHVLVETTPVAANGLKLSH
jgi:hypothetical protein